MTPDELNNAVVALLEEKGPLSRTAIRDIVLAGIHEIKGVLYALVDEGRLERFSSRIQNGRDYEYFCAPGTRYRHAGPVVSFGATEILAGFRQAVQASRDAGNNPFKVAV